MSVVCSDTAVVPFPVSESIRERVSAATRRAVAARSAKWLARVIGRSPQAAQKLLNGECSPSIETLAVLCREFDECWLEWRAICGREPSDAEEMLERFSKMLSERRRTTT